jgi:suppressor for copper-sensitivity B
MIGMMTGGGKRRRLACAMSLLRTLTLASILTSVSIAPAFAALGDWVQGDHVRMRLIATAPAADGYLDAAIQIALEPGWKTYWRAPGDAGIAPRLDFSGSSNASEPAIEFPAPKREDDGFAASNVYHNDVVLPVRFKASSAGGATGLVLKADIGVCEEICIPVSISARLDVPDGEADGAASGLIAEARAALPGPGRPGEFAIDSLKRVGGPDTMPEFEVRATIGDPDDGALFVETPPDWYPSAPKLASQKGDRAVYRFTVDRKTATVPLGGAGVRLTLTEGDAATARAFTLDPSKL